MRLDRQPVYAMIHAWTATHYLTTARTCGAKASVPTFGVYAVQRGGPALLSGDSMNHRTEQCKRCGAYKYRKVLRFRETIKKLYCAASYTHLDTLAEQARAKRETPQERHRQQVRAHSYHETHGRSRSVDLECVKCGSTDRVQIHHLGYDDPDLVLYLCASCHGHLHAGTLWEKRKPAMADRSKYYADRDNTYTGDL